MAFEEVSAIRCEHSCADGGQLASWPATDIKKSYIGVAANTGHSSRLAESGRLVRRMSHRVDPAAIAEEARTVRLDAVLGPPRWSVPVGDSSTPESRTLTPLIMVRIQESSSNSCVFVVSSLAGIVLKLPRVSDPANNPGVLVLSQFAGAAQELKSALTVNPYDIEATAGAIASAFTMPLDERKDRWHAMMAAPMLNNEKSPMNPPPIAAANVFCASENCTKPTDGSRNSAPPNVSCNIGDAAPMIPIPAETLRHRTAQISQNCGVLCASFRST
jgi:Glycosyltransferase family 20